LAGGFIKWGRESVGMDEIALRRKRLFSGAAFSSALFCNGGQAIGGSASFSYFSGCDVDGSYLVLWKKGGVLLTHGMNFAEAKEKCAYSVKKFGKKPLEELARACGRGKVAFVPSEMSAARYLLLRKKLKLADAGEKIAQVRGRKGAQEAQRIAAAARITRKILDRLNPWKFGTEAALDAHLRMRALEKGCTLAFDPIVAAGRNSSQPHHKAGRSRLGNFVLVDFGVKKDGYCSDFTRCYFRGNGASKERAAYGKCRKIFEEIAEALPGCKTGRDVAILGEKLMEMHGMPKLIHAIGHGVGMEVHEYPHLGAKSRDSLKAAALAIEPAAYFARFGVRYEGMVVHVGGKWREI
jgi:Xaa-Pro aminopeptidase